MRERIRAARDWAMESPKRAILTGIAGNLSMQHDKPIYFKDFELVKRLQQKK